MVATRPYRRAAYLLAAAVGVVGITFGVLADTAGLDLAQAVAMSALVFTGASQFAAASVVESGGTTAAAVGSALLLAARNALYGPVVARYLRGSLPRRLASAQFVIDETTAMATAQQTDDEARSAFWHTGIALYLLWNLGTVSGHVLGQAIGDPDAWGLDAAFPAAFVVLITPHLRTAAGRLAAGLGAALALVMVPLAPAGVPLLVAALAVGPASLLAMRRSTPHTEAEPT